MQARTFFLLLPLLAGTGLPALARPPQDTAGDQGTHHKRARSAERSEKQSHRARKKGQGEGAQMREAHREKTGGPKDGAGDTGPKPAVEDAKHADPSAPVEVAQKKTDAQSGGQKTDPKTDAKAKDGKPKDAKAAKTDAPADHAKADKPHDPSETEAPKLPERDQRASDKPKVGGPQTDGPPANRAALVQRLELAERNHRERLAKIARLRTLAQEKNQTDKLAALEQLERKENEVYERWRQTARTSLGQKDFDEVDQGLAHGRAHDARAHDTRNAPSDAQKSDRREHDAASDKPNSDKPNQDRAHANSDKKP